MNNNNTLSKKLKKFKNNNILSINTEISQIKEDFHDKFKETENDLIKIKNSLFLKSSKSE
jgi:hypothetical protein